MRKKIGLFWLKLIAFLCVLAIAGALLNLAGLRRLRALRKYFKLTSRRER